MRALRDKEPSTAFGLRLTSLRMTGLVLEGEVEQKALGVTGRVSKFFLEPGFARRASGGACAYTNFCAALRSLRLHYVASPSLYMYLMAGL
jgi:hypothetical protein